MSETRDNAVEMLRKAAYRIDECARALVELHGADSINQGDFTALLRQAADKLAASPSAVVPRSAVLSTADGYFVIGGDGKGRERFHLWHGKGEEKTAHIPCYIVRADSLSIIDDTHDRKEDAD